MTQQDDKLHSRQLSFGFSTGENNLETKSETSSTKVQHFMNREALSIRREAIERVRRDGIFSVYVRKK